MKKRLTILLISFILMPTLAACGGGDEDQQKAAAGDAVTAAANAFAEGFDNQDLTQFDGYFAPTATADDLANTRDAAHQFMTDAATGTTFQVDKLDIQNVQLDNKREEAQVAYQANVSMWANGLKTYSAVVNQDIALQNINGSWLITGGDAADVQPIEGSPTS